jgi:hypothetical protein
MNDLAAHLVDHVLPEVPVRQWVCTLPFGLRALCGYDRKLCAAVLGAFVQVVHQSYRRRAKRQLGLSSVHEAHPGSVTFVQRFDSALRLNVHAHTLALDGVYLRGPDGIEFAQLEPATHDDVLWVAEQSARRVARICERMGRSFEGPEVDDDALVAEQPVLAGCYAASAGGHGTLRLVASPSMSSPSKALVAEVWGLNVHAGVCVDGRDRARLERVCRYLARPALAQDRLSRLDDGRLCYRFKKPWADGTHSIVLAPCDRPAYVITAGSAEVNVASSAEVIAFSSAEVTMDA